MPTTEERWSLLGGANIPEGMLTPPRPRSEMQQEQLASFWIPFTDFRVWDALQTLLPGTPATDDLGLIGGTYGTSTPSIQTEDLKAAGATNKRARVLVQLPPEYDDGETVIIRATAGMLTTIADVTATLDIEAFKLDKEAGIDGADLVLTAAQSINSTTLATKDFNLNPSGLVSGDILDIRLTMAINDAATATAVKGLLGALELLCDIRG